MDIDETNCPFGEQGERSPGIFESMTATACDAPVKEVDKREGDFLSSL